MTSRAPRILLSVLLGIVLWAAPRRVFLSARLMGTPLRVDRQRCWVPARISHRGELRMSILIGEFRCNSMIFPGIFFRQVFFLSKPFGLPSHRSFIFSVTSPSPRTPDSPAVQRGAHFGSEPVERPGRSHCFLTYFPLFSLYQ